MATRSYLLMEKAYDEEGLAFPTSGFLDGLRLRRLPKKKRHRWFKRMEPLKLLYPRSYVERIRDLPHEKRYTYNFLGLLFRPVVFPHRKWILDFARSRFGEDCYFCITSLEGVEDYQALGSFDRTLLNADAGERFVPTQQKDKSQRSYFDPGYFEVMAASRFTLCPRGDAPWSMRFFEAILCRSIPVLDDPEFSGRNDLERGIGYRFYGPTDHHEFREDWVEENYRLFLEHQTLVGSKTDGKG